jgi:hypothetical protein
MEGHKIYSIGPGKIIPSHLPVAKRSTGINPDENGQA